MLLKRKDKSKFRHKTNQLHIPIPTFSSVFSKKGRLKSFRRP
ncbi:hypothetical protein HMPREF3156_00455, partial [Neisseria sp. HMSC06F02]